MALPAVEHESRPAVEQADPPVAAADSDPAARHERVSNRSRTLSRSRSDSRTCCSWQLRASAQDLFVLATREPYRQLGYQ